MDLGSIFQLSLCIAAADGDGIEFIRSDSPRKDLVVACRGIEIPLPVSLHYRDREWPFLLAHNDDGTIGILGLSLHRVLLVSFRSEGIGDFLVLDWIGAGHKIPARRAENLHERARQIDSLLRSGRWLLVPGWQRTFVTVARILPAQFPIASAPLNGWAVHRTGQRPAP